MSPVSSPQPSSVSPRSAFSPVRFSENPEVSKKLQDFRVGDVSIPESPRGPEFNAPPSGPAKKKYILLSDDPPLQPLLSLPRFNQPFGSEWQPPQKRRRMNEPEEKI